MLRRKISDSLKLYFATSSSTTINNIEKHRHAMAKSKGKPVIKCDTNGTIIEEYASIQEAARSIGVRHSAIQRVLKRGQTLTCCGWYWRYPHNEDSQVA